MKPYLTAFYILLICTSSIFPQERILRGTIQNTEDKSSLPYVNIGISQKGVGTVSDAKGIFNLQLTDKITKKDTLIFSCIGFETKKFLVAELLPSKNLIELKPLPTALEEVVVKAKKLKAKK